MPPDRALAKKKGEKLQCPDVQMRLRHIHTELTILSTRKVHPLNTDFEGVNTYMQTSMLYFIFLINLDRFDLKKIKRPSRENRRVTN